MKNFILRLALDHGGYWGYVVITKGYREIEKKGLKWIANGYTIIDINN